MESVSDEVEECKWVGGDPIGCVSECKRDRCWTFRAYRPVHHSRHFPFIEWESREVAEAAAHAYRYEHSRNHGLLRNEWRRVINHTKGDEWIEVKLTQGKIMQTRMVHFHFLQEYTWVSLEDHGAYYAVAYAVIDGTKKNVSFHRLVMADELKGNERLWVDHISGQTLDNRRENLRLVTPKGSGRNRATSKKNTSGTCGVVKSERAFRAFWCDNDGKLCSKSFSRKKYGDERAEALAIAVRKEKEGELEITVRPPRKRPDPPPATDDDETPAHATKRLRTEISTPTTSVPPAEEPERKQARLEDFFKPT